MTISVVFTILLFVSIPRTEGWTPGYILQSAAVGLTLAISSIDTTGSDLPSLPTNLEERIQQSLRPASDDKPQIMIPSNLLPAETSTPRPLVQGLVYLANPQIRPGPLDTLILTVRDYNHPDVVLAGAKLPISKVRFSFEFSMFDKNILPQKKELWDQVEGDLLVKVNVCPASLALPCTDGESSMKAQGISKLIKDLPGMDKGIQIRAGASLRLE